MSVREIIWFFKDIDTSAYLEMLHSKHEAQKHPQVAGAYLLGESPFYDPVKTEEFTIIVGFNKTPLPGALIDALADHPEIAADDMLVIWTMEQVIGLETTIGKLRHKRPKIDPAKREYFRQLAQTPFVFL